MGQRVTLGKGLTAAANGASVRVRVADPPFMFIADELGENGAAWTGSITIQHTTDQPPMPNNGGGVSNDGVTDANADWTDIGTINSGGDQISWSDPLYRVRAATSGITGGNPTVYMIENVKPLKPFSPR